MVESKGGDNQVQKLIDLLGERVFPKRNRWVYYFYCICQVRCLNRRGGRQLRRRQW